MPRHLWVLAFIIAPSALFAQDQTKPAAKLRSPVGTLLQRSGDKGWVTPVLYDAIPAAAPLAALPGARAILDVQEGDVRVILAGNLPELSPTPVLESIVTLQAPSSGRDLEFTLNRGRVLIENHKDDGAATVRAHIKGKSLDFSLLDKKTVVALELYSRWPAGAPFSKKPVANHEPVGELIFLVVKGKAEIELNKEKQPLQGPVMYRFDTRRGIEGPVPLKKAPDWANPAAASSAKAKTIQAAVEKLRRAIADKGVVPGLTSAQESADATLRQVAAYSGGAVDRLGPAIAALQDERAHEVRSAGVNALVHYIGRGSAEDIRLHETLMEDKLKAGQATIVLELLHGLSDEARQRPETYDTLITYLQSAQIAIRELAAWNLYRLVPQGKNIAFDAGGSADKLAQAQAAWRRLIPQGQVPKVTP